MKHAIIATSIVLCLAGASSAGLAQDQSRSADMQRITVTAVPGQYDAYEVALDTGFSLEARVGNTHGQYMQAQRATERSEALRMQGMSPVPLVAVAIDNSAGPGMSRRILLFDGNRAAIAVVDVYCRHSAPVAGNRCRLVPRRVSGEAAEALAARSAGRLPLAQVRVVASR